MYESHVARFRPRACNAARGVDADAFPPPRTSISSAVRSRERGACRASLRGRCRGPPELGRLLEGIGEPDEVRLAPFRAQQFDADRDAEWGAACWPGKAAREGDGR